MSLVDPHIQALRNALVADEVIRLWNVAMLKHPATGHLPKRPPEPVEFADSASVGTRQ